MSAAYRPPETDPVASPALTAETTARGAADSAETSARGAADAAEVTARGVADTALTAAVALKQDASTAATDSEVSALVTPLAARVTTVESSGGPAKLTATNAFTQPQTIDIGTASSTNLSLRRNNSSATTILKLESSNLGGRVTLAFRDDSAAGTDVARIVAHNATDPAGVAAGLRVYRRRATPRLDGLMHDNTFLIEADTDYGFVGVYGAKLLVNTHDTDNNLHTDQVGVEFSRSPTDAANETTQFLRNRDSGFGSNYLMRNLASADTAGPLLNVMNNNAGDDQQAIKVTQAGAAAGIHVLQTGAPVATAALRVESSVSITDSTASLIQFVSTSTSTTRPTMALTSSGSGNAALLLTQNSAGRAIQVTHNDAGGANASIDIARVGSSASKIGGLKVSATNAGVGGVYGIQVATDLRVELGTAAGTGKSFLEMWEQASDAAAPATDSVRVFAKDNGAGKTQLVARFPTGATVVIATEP